MDKLCFHTQMPTLINASSYSHSAHLSKLPVHLDGP